MIIRVTRPEKYTSNDCVGYTNLSARQGHYFQGETVNEALDEATQAYPTEVLDAQYWDGQGNRGDYIGRFKLQYYGTPDERRIELPPSPTVFVEAA
jgi:hypothetical protein